ncbi:hypothetical protein ACP26L_04045 [Paenibacillus sp. S-38]
MDGTAQLVAMMKSDGKTGDVDGSIHGMNAAALVTAETEGLTLV